MTGAMIAGAVAGAGLYLLVRALFPARPGLAARMAAFDAARRRDLEEAQAGRMAPTLDRVGGMHAKVRIVPPLALRWRWARILSGLQACADAIGLITWQVGMDSTVMRAHRHAAGAWRQGGSQDTSLGVSPEVTARQPGRSLSATAARWLPISST
ncbi:hypothetical protein AGRA3207_007606 [Actinomadura graeca]|uniref:Uncharacterized protein n=1 Tax=Actinomadura graeca TaxID=2750812 RepID=A0ABX8R659_9ACTN|nr:hypothetical protein AGRA3207_007606 [Actinomadura graeca]